MGDFLFHLLGNTFAADLVSVTRWIFVAIGALIIPIAIYFGFQLAYAEDEGKRRSVKKRLMNMLISAIIIIFLIGILTMVDLMGGFTDRDELNRNRLNLNWNNTVQTASTTLEIEQQISNMTGFGATLTHSTRTTQIPIRAGTRNLHGITDQWFISHVQIVNIDYFGQHGFSAQLLGVSSLRARNSNEPAWALNADWDNQNLQQNLDIAIVTLRVRAWGPIVYQEPELDASNFPQNTDEYTTSADWLVRIRFISSGTTGGGNIDGGSPGAGGEGWISPSDSQIHEMQARGIPRSQIWSQMSTFQIWLNRLNQMCDAELFMRLVIAEHGWIGGTGHHQARAAVANTVMNRARLRGQTLRQVILAPNQYTSANYGFWPSGATQPNRPSAAYSGHMTILDNFSRAQFYAARTAINLAMEGDIIQMTTGQPNVVYFVSRSHFDNQLRPTMVWWQSPIRGYRFFGEGTHGNTFFWV